jgi:glycosyltransferase involved in cell wall biosynthesis
MKQISVIVAVFNAERFLPELLASFDNNSDKTVEFIMVDDGSTDNSWQIISDYAKERRNVVVLKNRQNSGQVVTRKKGFAKSTGRYIWFVDADDWLADGAIARLQEAIAKYRTPDIIMFNTIFKNLDGNVKTQHAFPCSYYNKQRLATEIYPEMIMTKHFYFGIYAAMWNKLFRRQLVEQNFHYVDKNVGVGEDGLLTYPAMLDAQNLLIMPDYLYYYRNDNASITRSYVPGQLQNALRLFQQLQQIAHHKRSIFDITSQIHMWFLYNIHSTVVEEFYYRTGRRLADKVKDLRELVNNNPTVTATALYLSDNKYRDIDGVKLVKNLAKRRLSGVFWYGFYHARRKRLKLFLRKLRKSIASARILC